MRANFDYYPLIDPDLPCRELGLKFECRDVLHVVCRDNPNWWQAFQVGKEAEPKLPGLVPSPDFWRDKTLRQRALAAEEAARHSGGFLCFRNCFRVKKSVVPTGRPTVFSIRNRSSVSLVIQVMYVK